MLHHHTCILRVLILSSDTVLYPCPGSLTTQYHTKHYFSPMLHHHTCVPRVLPLMSTKKHCFSPVLPHHTCVPSVLILSSDTILYQWPQGLRTQFHKRHCFSQCYTIIHVSPVSWYSVVILYYTNDHKVLGLNSTQSIASPQCYIISVLILSSDTILYQWPQGLRTQFHTKHCFSPVLHHQCLDTQ